MKDRMKLNVPDSWSYDFDISRCGKFITLKLFIPNVSVMVGHRAKRVTIRAMFDCFQFEDCQTQITLIRLLETLNKSYHATIEIYPR